MNQDFISGCLSHLFCLAGICLVRGQDSVRRVRAFAVVAGRPLSKASGYALPLDELSCSARALNPAYVAKKVEAEANTKGTENREAVKLGTTRTKWQRGRFRTIIISRLVSSAQ